MLKVPYNGGMKEVDVSAKKERHLTAEERYVPLDWYEVGHNYLIQSDKGTGKSTSFLAYVKKLLATNPDQKVFSVVSRCALGMEQKKKAEELLGINITYYADYKKELWEWRGDGCVGDEPTYQFLITTPESLDAVY